MVTDRAPRVRLIVLEHDGGPDLLRCVESLLALEWPSDALEVVIVDNASTDGAAIEVARRHPEVRVIRSETNLGFAGNNLALADLDDLDYVGLVNNDAFAEPGYLAPLVEALESDPTAGAASPKMLLADRYVEVEVDVEVGARLDDPRAIAAAGWLRPDDLLDPRPVATDRRATVLRPVDTEDEPLTADGRPITGRSVRGPVDVINNVGNVVTDIWYGADRGLFHVDDGSFDVPVDVFSWSGGAVLLRKAYLESVGGFDPALFLYYEDLDVSWRGRTAGWRHVTGPAAVIRHRLGASTTVGSPLFRYHTERNRLVVLAIHAPPAVVVGAALRHLSATASILVRDVIVRAGSGQRPTARLAALRARAFLGFLRLLPHALRRRRDPRRATFSPRPTMKPPGRERSGR